MIAALATWNVKQNDSEVMLSDLALKNIEALASSEYPVIPGFNDYVQEKSWNFNFTPPRIQTTCYAGGTQVCA